MVRLAAELSFNRQVLVAACRNAKLEVFNCCCSLGSWVCAAECCEVLVDHSNFWCAGRS